MQIGPAQIGVNQENSAILLARQGVRKVIGDESFAFAWQGARDEDTAQRLLVANLIETRPQSPELFSHRWGSSRIYKDIALEIQAPARVRAARPYIIEAKKFCRSGLSIDLGMDQWHRVGQWVQYRRRWSRGRLRDMGLDLRHYWRRYLQWHDHLLFSAL